jgi:serine-type D-Ala-D-Ala carboxypeptidase (penicillin-binding protein 5/6)
MLFQTLFHRRLGLSLLALALILGPSRGFAFETDAQHLFIMDVDTKTVLVNKNGDDRIPTASMSKMMTAYVVFDQLKQGRLKLDDELTVSEKAWHTGGSKMFVPINGKVKVEDLIRGMIVQSGNDACVVLAEGISGSEDAFVKLMNDLAPKLGLKDSHFANVDGLPDPDHYMTPRDLAMLGLHVMQDFPEYYHYFSEIDFTYNNIKQGNRNPLLYKNSGADGIKTGHTDEAGFGLTASVKRGDRHIIMVATGLPSMKGRSQEAERIVDYAFREFQNFPIVKQGDELDEAQVWLGDKTKVPLVASGDLVVSMPRASRKDMKVTVSYDGPIKAPIQAGQQVGELTVTAPDMPSQTVPVVAGTAVGALGPMGRVGAALSHLVWGNKH